MTRWTDRGVLAVSVVVAVTIAACTGGASASPAATTSGAPPATAAATTTTAPAPPTSGPPSDGPVASIAEPPAATLRAEGGDPVTGQLGSFTWGDGGSDSPWLPGAPVAVGAGEQLTVTLGPGATVRDWTARRVPAGTQNGTGAVAVGGGSAPVAFPAPGPGTWSVQVEVTFDADRGSAAYYWEVTVR